MSRPRAWAKAAELKHSPPEWWRDPELTDEHLDAWTAEHAVDLAELAPNAEDISHLDARRMHG